MLAKIAVAAMLALSILPAHAQQPAKGVRVVEPWARATPPGAKVGAAYMELKAEKGAADKLLSASSPAAGTVEIHNHIMEGDIAKMRRVDFVPVPDGGSVTMEPGGYHVMLMDLKGQLKAGETIKLRLKFEKAGEMEVDAKVQPIGARKSKADHGPHNKH